LGISRSRSLGHKMYSDVGAESRKAISWMMGVVLRLLQWD
jgi:hypothetical protein